MPPELDPKVVTDAEVTQDVPSRQVKVTAKPLDVTKVFDADVNEATNAKTKGPAREAAPEEGGDAPPRTRKKKTKASDDEAPPEVTDRHLSKARNYIAMADGLHRAGLKARYKDILEPGSLAELDDTLKLNPAQVDLMAQPMAEGLARHGDVLPWYVELGIGALGIGMARANLCKSIEARYQTHLKAQKAGAK